MSDSERGQISENAAEIYDEFFLPSLFAEWPPRVIEAARIKSGQRVVDVACGTGVLALAVADRVGPQGSTIGFDINQGMLDVARKKAPKIEWRQAPAEALPLDDSSVDRVVSQFGLMYFDDRQRALCEMMRVLRPGGTMAVAVWDKLENSPGYAAEDRLFQRLLGDEAADEVPYSLGDQNILRQLFADAGISDVNIETHEGTARFPSIESWIYADVKGWTMDDMIDDEMHALLLSEARRELTSFVTADGTVAFPAPAHIATARTSAVNQ